MISTNDTQAIIHAKLFYHEDLIDRIAHEANPERHTEAIDQMARIIAEALQFEISRQSTLEQLDYIKNKLGSAGCSDVIVVKDWRTEPPSERRASMLKDAGE